MSVIAEAFARILPPQQAKTGGAGRLQGRGGFIPYITAGDPDLATSFEILLALGRAGATVIELGFPFSDPMADGPVIQRACARALKNRITMGDALALAREAKAKIDSPVVLFSYLNPVLQYGLERLLASAGENGISGLLLTDLPADNAVRLAALARRHGVDLITLAAPTCTDERLQTICAHASGFIYAVSRTGVTGTRQQLGAEARTLVERIRRYSSLPVALGFGVSNRAQAQEVLTFADAVVVGSAIVHEIETNIGSKELAAKVEKLARAFQPGLPTNAEIAFAGPAPKLAVRTKSE
jgi:tryptophan synthase alpha chain